MGIFLGGLKIEGEDESFDFGSGAGFYVDATKSPWNKGYKMYSYITSELTRTVFANFKEVDSERVSVFGHSMGGHGALTLVSTCFLSFVRERLRIPLLNIMRCPQFLKNPGKYKSVSAFAPIANPSNCQWGQKAFGGYFGEEEKAKWAEHDATELVKKWSGKPLDILIDVVRYPLPPYPPSMCAGVGTFS